MLVLSYFLPHCFFCGSVILLAASFLGSDFSPYYDLGFWSCSVICFHSLSSKYICQGFPGLSNRRMLYQMRTNKFSEFFLVHSLNLVVVSSKLYRLHFVQFCNLLVYKIWVTNCETTVGFIWQLIGDFGPFDVSSLDGAGWVHECFWTLLCFHEVMQHRLHINLRTICAFDHLLLCCCLRFVSDDNLADCPWLICYCVDWAIVWFCLSFLVIQLLFCHQNNSASCSHVSARSEENPINFSSSLFASYLSSYFVAWVLVSTVFSSSWVDCW